MTCQYLFYLFIPLLDQLIDLTVGNVFAVNVFLSFRACFFVGNLLVCVSQVGFDAAAELLRFITQLVDGKG